MDPDGLLSPSDKASSVSLLKEFQLVFDNRIPGYNGAAGQIEGVVNMGPVEPPQRKGRVPQYSRTNSTCSRASSTSSRPKASSAVQRI